MLNNFLHATWPAPPQVKTLITTRLGGYSKHNFASFNLALHVNDDNKQVKLNRNHLAQYLPATPYWLNQVHGNLVLNLDFAPIVFNNNSYDACITTLKQQVCAILTADCLPILLTDKIGSFVAAIHAGWKGLANGVIANTLAQIKASSNNILAFIGPAICKHHFEVGSEVVEIFTRLKPSNLQYFTLKDNDKYACNLKALATSQLITLGMLPTNIYLSNYCTYCHFNLFYSYRKNKITGRFASLIWLD